MSHPDPHHDPENVRIEDSKFAPKKKEVASKMNAWGQDEKTAKEVRKYLRDQKRAKRISKLVEKAPPGSALRGWSYSQRKYL